MELSLVGLIVFAILYLLGWWLGSGPFIGLVASLPIGSTAFVRLPAIGGSTPLIYTLFALVLLANVLLRRGVADELRTIFARHRSAWLVLVLMLLAIAGAILLPRLFEGETVALLPVDKVYREFPMRPSSKNVTQAGYFVLGTLIYFAVSIMLIDKPHRALIVKAFFVFCVVHTACGLIDLLAKRAGVGDVFAAIRTANYAMLSTDTIAGFPRLTGALPETSTFAMMALACLSFSFVHWRGTGSRLALSITVVNVILVFLSTSSTAYAGFSILCLPVAWSMVRSLLRDRRVSPQDGKALAIVILSAVISLTVFLTYDRPTSLVDLLKDTVIEKTTTASGVERFYFNAVSIRNFFDTYGLGVGLGSSRASGWPIAVVAQMGFPGALLMTVLLVVLLRGMRGVPRTRETTELIVAGDAVCASAVGGIVGASISAGSADPGIVFFVALAVVTSWRRHAQRAAAAL